jgi:hypothetical protein
MALQMAIFSGLSCLLHINQNWIWSCPVPFKTIHHPKPNICLHSSPMHFSWTLDCISPSIHEHWGKFTLFSPLYYIFKPFQSLRKKDKSAQTSTPQITDIKAESWKHLDCHTHHIPFISKQYSKLNCPTFWWPATLPDIDYICWVICWVLDPMLGLLACCIVLPLKLSQVTICYKKRPSSPPSKHNESTFNC